MEEGQGLSCTTGFLKQPRRRSPMQSRTICSRRTRFNVVHLNITKNRYVMSLRDQGDLVRNLTDWRERQPLFIHGHVAFIDFERFGLAPPIYINLIENLSNDFSLTTTSFDTETTTEWD
ncbi:hypothetical protein PMAYCL1PPCAC_02539 [Pristionchus mayeri]|uniref:Uncharacterized protein n=1 Tax=Pristionchus mayeri TaxID=1317129 RepID=A0AAN5C815_9BILA|nr:hypothetical protein PMAYCL1PPCAC_02539 [Pristionchus mayeri]